MEKKDIKFTQLDEMSDDSIIEYLMSRFEHSVFSGYRINGENEFMSCEYNGDYHVCYKMCDQIKEVIDEDATPTLLQPPEEEEYDDDEDD